MLSGMLGTLASADEGSSAGNIKVGSECGTAGGEHGPVRMDCQR